MPHTSGIRRPDSYPAYHLRVPPGTQVTRVAPGRWERRTFDLSAPAVWALPIRMIFPPGPGQPDSSRYEALYLAPTARDGGSASPAAGAAHRVILLDEDPANAARKRRAAAITRPGQWCLVAALTDSTLPTDSLTLLLTEAARLAE